MERTKLALLILGSACGGTSSATCTTATWGGDSPGATCAAAQIFVARDTGKIIPTDEELVRYLDRWIRAADAEPILMYRTPRRAPFDVGTFLVYTTNPDIENA